MPTFRLRRRQPPAAELAEQVAELIKASLPGLGMLPAGTSAASVAAAALQPGAQSTRGSADAALPRVDPMVAFGPGIPIFPAPLDPARRSGRAEPRRYEYPVSWNLHISSRQGRLLEWKVLRDFADRVDLVRKCLDLRKKELVSIPWDITVHPRAVRRVMRQSGEKNKARAAAMLADQLEEQIDLLCAWWDMPDQQNDLGWSDWLMMALEEHLVLDALTIYPRLNRGGSLYSFELLDGSTIKPLLDYRGATPLPPQPAYQQILYGFPRGEFTATSPDKVSDEFAADQLVYRPRDRRTMTPYGFSDVEKALLAGDLWLRRQQWIRAEYTEGVRPETWITSDADYTPTELANYENVINDELAGDTAERHRAKLLARGLNPVDMPQFGEKYTAEYDEHLVRLVCAMLDVQPTEIGFTPRHGLGGKGHEEGQADVGKRKSTRPMLAWLVALLNGISRAHLGMPDELTFTFQGLESEDEAEDAATRDRDLRNGSRTLNQIQADLGQPLYDFAEADMPWVDTGGKLVFLEGASIPEPAPEPGPGQPGGQEGGQNEPPNPEGAGGSASSEGQRVEARKFAGFAEQRIGRGRAWRDFAFTEVDETTAAKLNAAGAAGDLALVKTLAADVGKAGAPQGGARRPAEVEDWPGWALDLEIGRYYAPKIQRALTGAIDFAGLAREYRRIHGGVTKAATATTPERQTARSFVHQHLNSLDLAPAVQILRALYADAYAAGGHAATVTLERLGVTIAADLSGRVSWTAWRPGDPATAQLLRSGGSTPGLEGLLAQADVTIKSIRDGYLNRLGDALADSIAAGDNLQATADRLRGLLDTDRAVMIAHTETARAMTTATMETYRANSVAGRASISAEDERVCEQCAANEAAGPVPLNDLLPFGDPPVHPLCRCAVVPYLASEMGISPAEAVIIEAEGEPFEG